MDLVDDEGFAALDMTALRKRLKWAPEDEARLILREPPLPGDPVLVNQMLMFDPQRVKDVVFGYRIDPAKGNVIKRHRTDQGHRVSRPAVNCA